MKLRRIIAVCLVSSVLLIGCQSTSEKVPVLKDSLTGQSDIETVEQGDLYNIICFDAGIKPQTTSIAASHNGVITKVDAQLGQQVKQGDVLATISETKVIHQNEDVLKSEYEYEHSDLELSIEIAKKQLELICQDGSDSEILEQKLNIENLQLSMDQLEEEYNDGLYTGSQEATDTVTEGEATEYTITAPNDGQIAYITPDLLGSDVSSSSVLFMIASENLLIETEKIPESMMQGASRIYARYHTSESDLEVYDGSETGNLDSSKSYFKLVDSFQGAQAGEYVSIYVITDYKEDVTYIPVDALKADAAGYYVSLWKDGERSRQPVEIGLITTSYIEITSGVTKGDQILVSE